MKHLGSARCRVGRLLEVLVVSAHACGVFRLLARCKLGK